MELDFNIIANTLIAILIYNIIILHTIGPIISKWLFGAETLEKEKKTFKEKLKDKLEERMKTEK